MGRTFKKFYSVTGPVATHKHLSNEPRCATCSIVMTDTFGWPKSHCTFPAFVTRGSWRNLASDVVYRANDMGDVIEVTTVRSSAMQSEPLPPVKRIVCYSLSEVNATSEQFVMEAFVIDGW